MMDNINITHTDNTDNIITIIHILISIINHNSNMVIMIDKVIIIKVRIIIIVVK